MEKWGGTFKKWNVVTPQLFLLLFPLQRTLNPYEDWLVTVASPPLSPPAITDWQLRAANFVNTERQSRGGRPWEESGADCGTGRGRL